jgi:mannitol/fructose-specific phosphotransferase system IIA component (Ntr-type)
MKLGEFVNPKALVPRLQSTKRDEVIAELVDALVECGSVDPSFRDELIDLIIERENHGSTGFGKGVAVPHVKHEKIDGMTATIGISPQGVDFNALDKAPVYSIVLLLSSKDKPDEHLQAMENIFRNLQKDVFRRFLRQAGSAEEIMELIEEADAHQLQG